MEEQEFSHEGKMPAGRGGKSMRERTFPGDAGKPIQAKPLAPRCPQHPEQINERRNSAAPSPF
jgi:hypothetical protein